MGNTACGFAPPCEACPAIAASPSPVTHWRARRADGGGVPDEGGEGAA